MSDSYNKFENKLEVTRKALKLLERYNFGVSLETKSSLVSRDIDIFKNITNKQSCIVKMTITTYDDNISKKIEPFVSVFSERFDTIKKLSKNGIYTGILMTPMLPFITDSEENIVNIVRKAKECKVKFIYPKFGVTLRDIQKEYYYKKLKEKFPNVLEKYEKYPSTAYMHNALRTKELANIFVKECNKHNILYNMKDIISEYKKENKQLSLF
ncbi:SPL family radical SAM protein [Miniphocaeibacter massiliensis]|uniref:SPL family radical SAM protein n=1 Tax=Miniphocaeibacter massiliensis TaxID=2041841 RepID=UPI001A91F885|nr:radical SAM protein [Miniphocaeibacter massiliensis]